MSGGIVGCLPAPLASPTNWVLIATPHLWQLKNVSNHCYRCPLGREPPLEGTLPSPLAPSLNLDLSPFLGDLLGGLPKLLTVNWRDPHPLRRTVSNSASAHTSQYLSRLLCHSCFLLVALLTISSYWSIRVCRLGWGSQVGNIRKWSYWTFSTQNSLFSPFKTQPWSASFSFSCAEAQNRIFGFRLRFLPLCSFEPQMRINGVQNAFDKVYFETLVMRLDNGVIHFGLDNTKMQQYRIRTENYPIW